MTDRQPPARTPPRLARWLLERTVPERHREPFLGDLEEEYRASPVRTQRWYWSQALRSLPFFLRPTPGGKTAGEGAYSEAIRTVNPTEAGQSFRGKADTGSEAKADTLAWVLEWGVQLVRNGYPGWLGMSVGRGADDLGDRASYLRKGNRGWRQRGYRCARSGKRYG